MFMGCRKYYHPSVPITQSNLQIQCDFCQNIKDILHRSRKRLLLNSHGNSTDTEKLKQSQTKIKLQASQYRVLRQVLEKS